MRAERDEDDLRPLRTSRAKPERRLAYEIALGIVIGGVTLWLLNAAAVWLTARLLLGQLQLHLPS